MPAAHAASRLYITDIVLQKGDDAENALVEKGYSVMHPALTDGSGARIMLGYKTSSSEDGAITDVIISNDKDAAAKEFGDKKVSYQTVSGGSLKVGSGDNVKTAYLHYTKSAEAGNPLMAIHLMSEDTNSVEKFGQVMPLPTSVSAGQMMRITRSRDFCCIRARGFHQSGSRQRESSITVSVIR